MDDDKIFFNDEDVTTLRDGISKLLTILNEPVVDGNLTATATKHDQLSRAIHDHTTARHTKTTATEVSVEALRLVMGTAIEGFETLDHQLALAAKNGPR